LWHKANPIQFRRGEAAKSSREKHPQSQTLPIWQARSGRPEPTRTQQTEKTFAAPRTERARGHNTLSYCRADAERRKPKRGPSQCLLTLAAPRRDRRLGSTPWYTVGARASEPLTTVLQAGEGQQEARRMTRNGPKPREQGDPDQPTQPLTLRLCRRPRWPQRPAKTYRVCVLTQCHCSELLVWIRSAFEGPLPVCELSTVFYYDYDTVKQLITITSSTLIVDNYVTSLACLLLTPIMDVDNLWITCSLSVDNSALIHIVHICAGVHSLVGTKNVENSPCGYGSSLYHVDNFFISICTKILLDKHILTRYLPAWRLQYAYYHSEH